jgi:hypothetical protein
MMLARLALLVATYLSLDVSNPLMPGALTFGVEDSVEVRPSDRFRGEDQHVAAVPRAPAPERPDPLDGAVVRRQPPAGAAPRARQAPVTRSRLSVPSPASSIEDH